MSGWMVMLVGVAYVGLNFFALMRLINQVHDLAVRVIDLERRR